MERLARPEHDLDDVVEELETLSRAEIVEEMQIRHPDFEPGEQHTADVLRDELLRQAQGARAAAKERAEKASPEAKVKKQKRILKQKSTEELRSLLSGVGVGYSEGATAKELRELAIRHDALSKWDALPEEVRLATNRQHTSAKVGAAVAAERERARLAEEAKNTYDKENPNFGAEYMKARQPPPEPHPWEIEWDASDEEEALERLSKLEQYKTMEPSQVEQLMAKIRKNKGLLAQMENEERTNKIVADAAAAGQSLTAGDLKRLGMDYISFEKGKSLDEIKLDASSLLKGNQRG